MNSTLPIIIIPSFAFTYSWGLEMVQKKLQYSNKNPTPQDQKTVFFGPATLFSVGFSALTNTEFFSCEPKGFRVNEGGFWGFEPTILG